MPFYIWSKGTAFRVAPMEPEDEPGFHRVEQPLYEIFADEHTGTDYLFVCPLPPDAGSSGWYN